MSKNRVLITGGAGFLGSHVAKRLLKDGYEVVALDDLSNGKREHLNDIIDDDRFTFVEGDITVPGTVKELASGCSVLIHLAVLGLRQSIKDPWRVNEVIVDGTMHCLDAARDAKMELFLNCSSSEAYGSAVEVPMSEEHPLNPETPYAAAKVAQDKYVYSYGRTYGLPWVTVRPFNMYGPNSHWQGFRGELIPKLIVKAMNRKPITVFGDGKQTRDFIYVEDAARLLSEIMRHPEARGEEFNMCTGVETTILSIATLICEAFGLDPEEMIEWQDPRPADVRRHMGDNRKLKERLGLAADITFKDGLEKTIAWMKALPYTAEELAAQEITRSWE